MKFGIINTKGWLQKNWIGIGREYNTWGDLDNINFDFIIFSIVVYLK